jgi:hypothetical protein
VFTPDDRAMIKIIISRINLCEYALNKSGGMILFSDKDLILSEVRIGKGMQENPQI